MMNSHDISLSQMSMSSKIAVVMATFNPDLRFFRDQISSLKEQSHQNWKCYVSDDRSDDHIIKAINEIISSDSRFILVVNKGLQGAYYNFENALKLITVDFNFIAFCDQDDVWEKNKLQKLTERLEDPTAQVVHSDLSLIDSAGNQMADSCWHKEGRDFSRDDLYSLFLRNNITGCSMMFRREILNEALPFPKQKARIGFYHDHWISLIGHMKGKICRIEEPLIRYRQHDHNVVGASLKNKKSLYKKITDLKFVFKKSKWALEQRENLYSALIDRMPESRNYLIMWKTGIFIFGLDLIKRAALHSMMRRLGLQLVIARILKFKIFSKCK